MLFLKDGAEYDEYGNRKQYQQNQARSNIPRGYNRRGYLEEQQFVYFHPTLPTTNPTQLNTPNILGINNTHLSVEKPQLAYPSLRFTQLERTIVRATAVPIPGVDFPKSLKR